MIPPPAPPPEGDKLPLPPPAGDNNPCPLREGYILYVFSCAITFTLPLKALNTTDIDDSTPVK